MHLVKKNNTNFEEIATLTTYSWDVKDTYDLICP
jgi:hypothetical protein